MIYPLKGMVKRKFYYAVYRITLSHSVIRYITGF